MPVGNIARADSFQLPLEHIPYHTGGVFIYQQAVAVLRVLPVAKNSKRADEISALAFDFKLAPCFHRGIPAICLVYEVFERDDQLIRFHVAVQTVIVVVDCDKTHTKEGK